MMNTVKANNQSQAKKELQSIDEALLKSVNFDIKESDAKNYHVALVRISERSGQVKNKVTVTTHQYNERSFLKLKKQVAFLGYAHAIVLHDPKNIQNTKPTKIKGDVDFNIAIATIKQLKDFAIANEINLKDAKLLEDLRTEVENWIDAVRLEEESK